MKDSHHLRNTHNGRVTFPGLSWTNIAMPDGLYVIPVELVEQHGQPNKILVKGISGGLLGALLGIVLTLMLLGLFLYCLMRY